MGARQMDATQWRAVLEALDEVESRIPADEFTDEFEPKLVELRVLAKRAFAFARLGTGVPVSPSRSPEEK